MRQLARATQCDTGWGVDEGERDDRWGGPGKAAGKGNVVECRGTRGDMGGRQGKVAV